MAASGLTAGYEPLCVLLVLPETMSICVGCTAVGSPTNAEYNVNATVSIAVAAAEMIAPAGEKRLPVYVWSSHPASSSASPADPRGFMSVCRYPFAWECYHNGSTLLDKEDLKIDLTAPYDTPAQFLRSASSNKFIKRRPLG